MNSRSLDRALCASVVLLFLTVISDVVTRGMMPDGTLYAGIARELAAGQGSFWFPPDYVAGATSFHDHPPLGFWLQSMFFRLLGDAFWVENAYAVAVLIPTCLIVYRLAVIETGTGWYAVLIFLIFPLCAFAYTNNFLENTLTLLTLASVAAALASASDTTAAARLALLSGLLVFLAVLTKGPVGLFPLATYPIMALCGRASKPTSPLRLWFIQLAVALGATVALLLLWPDARGAAQAYIDAQLVSTFNGERLVQFDRVYLISRLGLNLLGPIIYSSLLLAAFRSRPVIPPALLLYLVLALSASLPLLISPRHYIHYLLPSLPFYALTIAILAKPAVDRMTDALLASHLRRRLALAAPIVLTGVLCVTFVLRFGDISDDPGQLLAADRFARVVPAGGELGLCAGEVLDLRLRMYLFRYYTIKVADSADAPLLICRTTDETDPAATEVEGALITIRARADS